MLYLNCLIYDLYVLNKFDKFKWKVSAVYKCEAVNLSSSHNYLMLHTHLDHLSMYYIFNKDMQDSD